MGDKLKDVTVLYVEDEEEVRNAIAKALRRRVGDIVTASNGKEGLELFTKDKPDIVVTDLEMPIMSGIVMIEKIRELYGSGYPIIVVTAYKDDEHYTPLANGYIYKPIHFDELEEMMASLVEKMGKQRQGDGE
jgi:YesN/AraC family two-component response regulator